MFDRKKQKYRNNNINIYDNSYISYIVVTDSLDGELYHNDLDTVKTPTEYVDPGCRPVICKINKKFILIRC